MAERHYDQRYLTKKISSFFNRFEQSYFLNFVDYACTLLHIILVFQKKKKVSTNLVTKNLTSERNNNVWLKKLNSAITDTRKECNHFRDEGFSCRTLQKQENYFWMLRVSTGFTVNLPMRPKLAFLSPFVRLLGKKLFHLVA